MRATLALIGLKKCVREIRIFQEYSKELRFVSNYENSGGENTIATYLHIAASKITTNIRKYTRTPLTSLRQVSV